MSSTNMLADDSLIDFARRDVDVDGASRLVYVSGSGPAVIVMAEIPGITPHLTRFARWVRDAGFTVYMPSLFGRDGAVPDATEAGQIFKRVCVSAEFQTLGGGRPSPVAEWLRGLARVAHAECGGPGVGAVGMCFTGNFALSMALEPAVLAPVLAQPSLPLSDLAAIDIDPEEIVAVRRRLERDGLTVLGLRFEGDLICTRQRFDAYREALGDRFVARTLPDSAAGTEQLPPFHATYVPFPHSVLTVHLVDEAGSPTAQARDEVIAFFHDRLTGGASVPEA